MQGLFTLHASGGAGSGGVRFPESISGQQTSDGDADCRESRAIRDELPRGDTHRYFARSHSTCPARPLGEWDQRAEYTIGVAGCGKRTTFVVICPDGGEGCFGAGPGPFHNW